VPDKPLNIKVTIEIDGPSADVAAWLAQLPKDGMNVSSASDWSVELMEALVRRISPRAREVLWHIADSAPSISFEELQDELKIDGVKLGGVLASFGFAERAGIPRPYTANRTTRQYEMDPDVARLALDALRKR
jgi:hypothetical protein